MRSLGKMSLLDLPGPRVCSGPGTFTNDASFYLQHIPLLALLTEQGNRSSESWDELPTVSRWYRLDFQSDPLLLLSSGGSPSTLSLAEGPWRHLGYDLLMD